MNYPSKLRKMSETRESKQQCSIIVLIYQSQGKMLATRKQCFNTHFPSTYSADVPQLSITLTYLSTISGAWEGRY